MMEFLKQITDPYERKARATPALLVALPVLIPLVSAYGPRDPALMAVVALFSTCGVIYALSSIARGRGKALEERLVQDWGGLPTTIVLRHRDAYLEGPTKARYHEAIEKKLGMKIPSAEEEAANPRAADEAYAGASRRLRELTRNNPPLLLKENTAYGFHRNMVAMKPLGIFSSLVGFTYGILLSKTIAFKPIQMFPERMADPGLPAGLTLACSLLLLWAWCFYFKKSMVRRIGFAYAERLYEQLGALTTPRTKSAAKP